MKVNANIYNHLSSSLVPRKVTTAHKSSELKAVYNSMSKYNKNSPLYLLSLSESNQNHMINIKEAAHTLRDVATSFSMQNSEVYSKKELYSSNSRAITGILKNPNSHSLPEAFTIQVKSLANEQVNTGNYVRSNDLSLSPKEHSLILETINSSSRFDISISSTDTNLDVQKRLAQYINNRTLGVNVSVLTEGKNSALMLSSSETGIPSTEDGLHFTVKDDSSGKSLVDILGLSHTTTFPANSEFYINGEKHTSSSNHISINQMVELDFLSCTVEPVNVNFISDTKEALDQIKAFSDSYNRLIDLSPAGSGSLGSRNLLQDISGIVNNHKAELKEAGIEIDDSNRLVKNDSKLISNIRNGKLSELFGESSTLKEDIYRATNRLTLDPAAYINKLIVTYPNSNNKHNNTYTQSLYSGMMYNNYV